MSFRFALFALLLSGCADFAPQGVAAPGVEALLLGEQHDADTHPALQRDWVERLVREGRLAAVALEMAEHGASTQGLAVHASEDEVRQALRWNDEAWPWSRYGPVVMAAVRAGVPVLGANLPRDAMRGAMAQEALDASLPAAALAAQRDAVRTGHCDLLPESRIAAMVRVQIARDRAMARTLHSAARPGKTVLLVAGSGHVDPEVGVPRHLPAGVTARSLVLPPQATGRDYCAELRRQMGK